MSEEKLPRLPAGRHGLPADVVAENQRQRLVDAFARVVVDKGFRATTVADITSLASVSRNVFYEQFGGKAECFIAAYEAVRADIRGRIIAAANRFSEPPEQLVAAVRAGLDYFAAEPDLARLMLVEPLGAGPEMTSHHQQAVGDLVERLHRTISGSDSPPSRGEEILILGAVSLLVRRINMGEAAKLSSLLPELADVLLSPRFDEERIAAALATVEATAGRPKSSS